MYLYVILIMFTKLYLMNYNLCEIIKNEYIFLSQIYESSHDSYHHMLVCVMLLTDYR